MVQVTGGAELKVYFSINGQLAINVYGVLVTGSPTFGQGLADTVGAAVKGAWSTNIAPLCSSTTSLVRVGLRDLRTDGQTEFRETGAAVAGTGTGDGMPGNNAICVTLRTAQSGKSFRGRSYLSGFNETQNLASGLAAAAAGTAAVTYVGAINTLLAQNAMALGVMTRPQDELTLIKERRVNGELVETRVLSHQTQKPGAVTRVTGIESRNTFWESQRRRSNGRGALPASLDAVFSLPV